MPAARGHSSDERASRSGDGARYEIVVRGQLGRALSVWFSEMEIRSFGDDEISVHRAENDDGTDTNQMDGLSVRGADARADGSRASSK